MLFPVRPRTRVRFPPPPPFPASELFLDRNSSRRRASIGIVVRSSFAPDLPELLLEVGGRALDVDVRGRADVRMAEELLGRVDIARGEVELRARRVAGTVHLLAVRRALVDDAGAGQAAVPP